MCCSPHVKNQFMCSVHYVTVFVYVHIHVHVRIIVGYILSENDRTCTLVCVQCTMYTKCICKLVIR